METAFKIVFFLAVLSFCAVIIGIFLLFVKVTFLINEPQLTIMGILMTPAP